MDPAIIVHRPRPAGGRHVTVLGQGTGVAHSDRDLIEFLRQSGLDETDAEAMVDGDSTEIELVGAPAHRYGAGPSLTGLEGEHRPEVIDDPFRRRLGNPK